MAASVLSGPIAVGSGAHDGHWTPVNTYSSPPSRLASSGSKRVIITGHLNTNFNGGPDCGMPNCLVAFTSTDNGATWAVVEGPVMISTSGSSPTFGQFYTRPCPTKIGNTIYVTYCGSSGKLHVCPFSITSLTWGSPVEIATFDSTPVSGFTPTPEGCSAIANNGIGVIRNLRNPLSGDPAKFTYNQFDVTSGLLNTEDIQDASEAAWTFSITGCPLFVDDTGVVRILYLAQNNPNQHITCAGWPTDQAAPTVYDIGPSVALASFFVPGSSWIREGTKFIVPYRHTGSATTVGQVFYATRSGSNMVMTIETTFNQAVQLDNEAFDRAICGICPEGDFVIWGNHTNATNTKKLKLYRKLGVTAGTWDSFTTELIHSYVTPANPNYWSNNRAFFGAPYNSTIYELVTTSAASEISGSDPVQFTPTVRLWFWRIGDACSAMSEGLFPGGGIPVEGSNVCVGQE